MESSCSPLSLWVSASRQSLLPAFSLAGRATASHSSCPISPSPSSLFSRELMSRACCVRSRWSTRKAQTISRRDCPTIKPFPRSSKIRLMTFPRAPVLMNTSTIRNRRAYRNSPPPNHQRERPLPVARRPGGAGLPRGHRRGLRRRRGRSRRQGPSRRPHRRRTLHRPRPTIGNRLYLRIGLILATFSTHKRFSGSEPPPLPPLTLTWTLPSKPGGRTRDLGAVQERTLKVAAEPATRHLSHSASEED